MSDCTIPTLAISSTDAVGDSAGKHNYNALVLDTNICNLSSQFFLDYNNIDSMFQSLTSYIQTFTQVASSYNDDRVYKMSEAATTVKILSSYWNKQEFSIQYPINGAILNPTTDTINAPALSTVNQVNLIKTINTRLKPLANIYLNSNFPATSFIDGTIVNVNFFLYNVSPNPTNPNHLITFNATPNVFGYRVRNMDVTFYRDNVYFTQGVNLRYFKQNNVWNYIGYNAGTYSESLNIGSPTTKPVTIAPSPLSLLPTKTLKSFVFTTNSSITIPIDVNKVLVLLVGGGGGGGAGYTGTTYGGGGGGGGIILQTYTVSPNTSYNVKVGQGGNGGAAGSTGFQGGSSVFGALTALGGYGGIGANPTYGNASQGGDNGGGQDGGHGGNGRGFFPPSKGQDGYLYSDVINYPNGIYFSGGGGGAGAIGDLELVVGGQGGGARGGIGFFPGSLGAANTGGGGGGGGESNSSGGQGASGIVIVSYYTSH
jgi:hypothetical protein